jgi:hypothetical protein
MMCEGKYWTLLGKWKLICFLLNVAVEGLALVLCIQEVLGSNLGSHTGSADLSHGNKTGAVYCHRILKCYVVIYL